jgi:hypothetical protein
LLKALNIYADFGAFCEFKNLKLIIQYLIKMQEIKNRWAIKNYFITFMLLFLFTNNSFAQDVITRLDGTQIYGKIIKEDSTNLYIIATVKNKRYETFISKSKVQKVYYDQNFSIDTILPYRNGMLSFKDGFWTTKYYQNNIPVTRYHFIDVLSQNPLALEKYNKGTSSKLIAGVFGFVSGYLIGRSLFKEFNNRQFVIAGTIFLGGILIDSNGNRNQKKAIDIYNSSLP